MERHAENGELRHKAVSEVPEEQGLNTVCDVLLPDEVGARLLFLPEHYSCVCCHVFSCLTTGDKHASPLLAVD